jgi:transcription elongation factor GreA
MLSEEGLKKLEAELEYLRTVRRLEVADRIREALEFGDAWENPEYESAKTEQAFVQGRVKTLEETLRNARIIKGHEAAADVVSLGTWVRLRDIRTSDETEYLIVGSAEADPLQQKISNKSPVARAVLGHRVGELVKAQVPVGLLELEILSVRMGEGHLVSSGETA